ncbi:MAG: hypothetical protein PHX21_04965 [bacterium]|nr:hypothetical protein [bacterium]
MGYKVLGYIIIGNLFITPVYAKRQCEIAKLDMRGIKFVGRDSLSNKPDKPFLSTLYTTSATKIYANKQYEIYTPGREWAYKTFFLNTKGDTVKTGNITLKTPPKASHYRKKALWCYTDKTLNEERPIEEDDYGIVVYPPTKQDFQFTKIATFPQFIYYISGPFVDTIDGEEWVVRQRGMSSGFSYKKGDKEIISIKEGTPRIEYYKPSGQKDISTPAGEFKNCWQIDTKGRISTEIYKTIYYFHPEYGFVRWEYTKPDSTQVIFVLEKVSGFNKKK